MANISHIEKLLVEKKEDIAYYENKIKNCSLAEKKQWEDFHFDPNVSNLEDLKVEVEALELLLREEKELLEMDEWMDREAKAEELRAERI